MQSPIDKSSQLMYLLQLQILNVRAISQKIKVKHSQMARLEAQEHEIIDQCKLARLEEESKEKKINFKIHDRRN